MGISDLKQENVKNCRLICTFELVYVPNFILNLHFFIFWAKFTQKEYVQSKTEKVNTPLKFCVVTVVQVPNFSSN